MRHLIKETLRGNPSGRFGLLTAAILLMMLVRPFYKLDAEVELVSDSIFAAVLVIGVYSARGNQYNFWLALPLAFLGCMGWMLHRLFGWSDAPLFTDIAARLFLTHTLYHVAAHIHAERHRVTLDIIFAAICAFLLLGFIWSFAYYFLSIGSRTHSGEAICR